MERKSAHHSTNRDGLLLRSESSFVLQWGSRKRLRCMKVHGKDPSTKNDPTGSRPVHRATARVDRRAVRSGININNSNRDSMPNQQNNSSSIKSGHGHLNLRQRPASPSRRILSHHGSGGSGSSEIAHDGKRSGSPGGGDTVAAMWPPKFAIALTNKEKEEDFMAIKGSKLPQRPEKRAKLIQRTLNEMEGPYFDEIRRFITLPPVMSAREPCCGNISKKNEFFLVKVAAEISGHDRGEKIAKMEAICNVCSHLLQEAADISVLKTKCRCRLSLVHEKCYTENPANKHNNQDKCDVCTEITEYIPVTLSRSDDGPPAGDHSQLPDSSKRSNKWFSRSTRS